MQSPPLLGSLAGAMLIVSTVVGGCRSADEGVQAAERVSGAARSASPGDVDMSAVPPELVFPGAEARGRFSQNMGDMNGVSYVLEAGQPSPRVIAHYDGVTALVRSSKRETPAGTLFEFQGKNPRETYAVTIAPSTGKTGITVLCTRPN